MDNTIYNELIKVKDKQVKQMKDSKQEYLDAIQSKMIALMERLKQEEDHMLLSHLADSGELLLSGLTAYDKSAGDYQVKLDTYTAADGFKGEQLIYRTSDVNVAFEVFENVLDAIDNTAIFIDENGNYSM